MRIVMVAMLLAGMPAPAASATESALPPLAEVLERADRVADLYRDQALRFTCDETIYFSGWGAPQIHKFEYIYRYSGSDDKLGDYRTARGRAERKSAARQQQARLDNYGLPTFLRRAYSWVFLFREEYRSMYRFELRGADRLAGRAAIRVRFESIPPYREGFNEWAGTAWIDRRTYQLLRVEAIHVDHLKQYELLQRALEVPRTESSPGPGSYTFTQVLTEFDVVKNGMRFPGRVTMNNSTHVVTVTDKAASVRENPVFQITQTYKKYRFFGVRTEEQIRRIVEGD